MDTETKRRGKVMQEGRTEREKRGDEDEKNEYCGRKGERELERN